MARAALVIVSVSRVPCLAQQVGGAVGACSFRRVPFSLVSRVRPLASWARQRRRVRLISTRSRLRSRVAALEKRVDALSPAALPGGPAAEAEALTAFVIDVPGTRTIPARRFHVRAPRRQFVVRELEKKGFAGYEPATIATFLTLAEQTGEGAILDVGANVGVFALAAAGWFPDRRVVAFEPTPDLASWCSRLARDNGLDLQVEQLALGDKQGTFTLYLSSTTDASNSLRRGFRKAAGEVEVEVETLDRFVTAQAVVPSVVKIDTESTEPDVLRGAEGLLASHRPWIICEVLSGRTEADLMPILQRHDYRAYHLTDRAVPDRALVIQGDPDYKHLNWLFAPQEPTDGFWRRRDEWVRALRGSSVSPVA